MSWISTLEHLSALEITGADAGEFLHAQLTTDVRSLSPGRAALSAWLSPRGQVIAVLRIAACAASWRVYLPQTMAATVAQRLRGFVLRAKVRIQDLSGEVVIVGCGEPAEPPAADRGAVVSHQVEGAGAARTLLSGPAAEVEAALATSPAPRAPAQRWQLEDIRAGLPMVWPETSETFLAQMLNLDLLGAISFDKGCYPGQEIVARAHHLGRVKRRMRRYWTPGDAAPAPGAALLSDGEPAGRVVSSAANLDGGIELLAVVPVQLATLSARLHTASGAPLERLVLPYAVPEPEGG